MKLSITILFFTSFLFMTSCAQNINLGKVAEGILGGTSGGGLTSGEIAAGLKEALIVGIDKGATQLSQTDGYFANPKIKIPFPEDVQKVENALRKVGLGNEVDKFVLALNRGAEEAAKEAKPIFVSAIKQMTISDAVSILKGEQDAATQYLKRTTSAQLTEKFMPVVEKALGKTQATKYYSDLANAYNRIPFTQNKVDPDLKGYATQKAIDGLFLMIANEEAEIRKDPLARTSALLKKVFGSI
ncbi:DUF4197 domain-containing protein [Marinilongibacter aquaticus]|uniref:DUF4197 domain-containing protein n=1 Tax=Marinilongibacter aquaticus TaxID=2975157 RepID=UPI0021BD540C|nr:DUF4197 domain-containing protein [Marinilongibacter aquaticus]UBM59118.1 DUF4197 domain-containing protein [Marinilongibacter aquaticus]